MPDEVREYTPNRFCEANLSHVLEGDSYQHAHFTDVSGKGATFENFDFSYCIFTRGYFHKATFSSCRFVGAHFVDCNFRNATFRDCDFSYSSFSGTRIPTKEILNNLPSWPNVRRDLLQILRKNAASVGDYKSEKVFIIREIDAEKEHYRRAWRRDEPYYQSKFRSRLKWLFAGFKFLALNIDSFVWGHGERLWKTPIALAILIVIFSGILTAAGIPGTESITLKETINHFYMAIIYNMNLFFGLTYAPNIDRLLIIDWLVVSARFVVIGLIVAALYRRLSHR